MNSHIFKFLILCSVVFSLSAMEIEVEHTVIKIEKTGTQTKKNAKKYNSIGRALRIDMLDKKSLDLIAQSCGYTHINKLQQAQQ